MTIRTARALLLLSALFAMCAHPAAAGTLPLTAISDIPLSGGTTRLDYQSFDSTRHMLFIAHLGDGTVIAFDTKARRIAETISNIAAVHGVLAVPQLNTVFASATGTNGLVAIDETTLKIKWRTGAGIYPDGIAYDPATNRLFVSDEHGATDMVIDARHGRHIATIPLGGQVGNTQYDSISHHIFVNAEGTGQLVEIDPYNTHILGHTALPGCAGNHGLLIDPIHRRAFIACEENATLVWLDMRTMRIGGRWTVGKDPDVLALDTRNNIFYVSAESGVVSLFANAKSVMRLAQGFLAPAAHTVCVNPENNLTYWPLQNIGGRPVLRIMKLTAGGTSLEIRHAGSGKGRPHRLPLAHQALHRFER